MIKKYLTVLLAALMIYIPCGFAVTDTINIATEISPSEAYPSVGDTISVSATLTNNGDALSLENAFLSYGILDGDVYTEIDKSDPFAPASVATGETATAALSDIEITQLPTYIRILINGDTFNETVIESADIYEFGDISVATATGDDDTKLYFTVSGELKNTANGTGSALTAALVCGDAEIASADIAPIAGGSSTPVSFNAEFLKSEFTEAEKAFRLIIKNGEDEVASADGKFINETVITDVIINSGNPVTAFVGDSFVLAAEFVPSASACEYTFTSTDSEIISVGDDGKTLTAVKTGTTTITFTAGNYTKTVSVEILPAPRPADITNISAYYMDGEEKVNLEFSKPFRSYEYNGYRIDIPENVSAIGFDITAPDGATLTYTQENDNDRERSIDDITNVGANFSGGYYIVNIASVLGDSDEVSKYTFKINNLPVISEEFKTEIDIFANLEYEIKLDKYYSDIEDDDILYTLKVTEKETGKVLGTSKKSDGKWYWKFKTEDEEGEIEAIFTFTDKFGGSVDVPVTLKIGSDNEKPVWNVSSVPTASSITASAAKLRWNKAIDNDRIAYYTVYYFDKPSRVNKVKVSAGDGIETIAQLTGLSANSKYTVYVEAYDRSDNMIKGDEGEFKTKKSSSNTSPSSSGNSGGSVLKPVTPIPSAPVATAAFNDLTNYGWAEKEITELSKKGIIKGTGDKIFSPAANIRRADFVVLLVRGLNLESDTALTFADVPADSYYAQAVGIAKSLGIISGSGNDLFNPENNITRQDMLVMAKRALEYKGKYSYSPAETLFGDDSLIAEYAKESVYSLAAAGIVKGDTNGNANPLGLTTRAEAAVILYRILAV